MWSRRNPFVQMSFLGLFNFTAPYLPWVSPQALTRSPTAHCTRQQTEQIISPACSSPYISQDALLLCYRFLLGFSLPCLFSPHSSPRTLFLCCPLLAVVTPGAPVPELACHHSSPFAQVCHSCGRPHTDRSCVVCSWCAMHCPLQVLLGFSVLLGNSAVVDLLVRATASSCMYPSSLVNVRLVTREDAHALS